MAKTRGVFALILDPQKQTVFISDRQDGKGWNLPGGRVEKVSAQGQPDAWESDEAALIREVREETEELDPQTGNTVPGTGLQIKVLCKVGPDHVFNEDTAVAYLCQVLSGEARPSTEARRHECVNAEELKQGYCVIRGREVQDGIVFTTGEEKIPLKLVGPEGRLGRTGRMLWDGLSLFALPILPDAAEVTVSTDGTQLLCGGHAVPRLDPYSPTGKIEPKA